jgi:putative flippase GtrA
MLKGAEKVGLFLLSGGFGAVTYFVVSTVICRSGIPPWIASGATYLALIPIIYYIQKRFVFSSNSPHAATFPRYVGTQAVSFSISIALPLILVGLDVRPEVSFGFVVVVSGVVGYIFQSRWVFPSS